MPRRVTIQTIAAACNTSIGTVDRALNNRSGISNETRMMVLAKARELGYHTNRLSYDNDSLKKIAYIDYCSASPNHDFLMKGVVSAREELALYKLGVEYFDALAFSAHDEDELVSEINQGIYDGVVFNVLGNEPEPIVSRINKNNPVFIATSGGEGSWNYDVIIGSDSEQAGKMAGQLAGLFAKDEDNVAVITNVLSQRYVFYGRFVGFCAVLKDEFPLLNLKSYVLKYSSVEEAKTQLLELFANKEINVLHTTDFNGTLGAVRALKELGRKDVRLIGYDVCYEAAKALEDGYCTALIYFDTCEYAKKSIEFVAKRILSEGAKGEKLEYLVEPQIIMKHNARSLTRG